DPDPRLRLDLGRALQPGGDALVRVAGRAAVARGAGLRGRAARRRVRRHGGGAPDVRSARLLGGDARARGRVAGVQRADRDVRSSRGDLGHRARAPGGGYITSAYWFTASTSFANPAVTLARAATDTFAGIRLVDVPFFMAAQLA